jgi:hypothetical protein
MVNLPSNTTTTVLPPIVYTTPQPISHPILGIHIHNYIKFRVTTAGENFSKWRQIITFLLTMYKALDHITAGTSPQVPDDLWMAVDIHISLWFMATLSDDLHRLVSSPDGRAGSTWACLMRFFLDNEESRYLFLSKAFRSTLRGDLPISTYASKLQRIVDDLAAIGRPVDDHDLTLQFIDGLGDQYKLQAEILKTSVPSFADACSRLQRAKIDAASTIQHAGDQELAVQTGGRAAPNGGGNSTRPPGVSPNYHGRNPIPGFQYGQNQQHGGARGSGQQQGSGRGRGGGQQEHYSG